MILLMCRSEEETPVKSAVGEPTLTGVEAADVPSYFLSHTAADGELDHATDRYA